MMPTRIERRKKMGIADILKHSASITKEAKRVEPMFDCITDIFNGEHSVYVDLIPKFELGSITIQIMVDRQSPEWIVNHVLSVLRGWYGCKFERNDNGYIKSISYKTQILGIQVDIDLYSAVGCEWVPDVERSSMLSSYKLQCAEG